MSDYVESVGVYTIEDTVAGECGPPFVAVNDGVAMRQFKQLIIKEQPDVVSDYNLLRIGHYNRVTGVISPCDHVAINRVSPDMEKIYENIVDAIGHNGKK